MIRKFIIHFPQHKLDDLKSRIRNTRWTDHLTDTGWAFGAAREYMKELTDYWLNKYNWRKTEEELNSYPNFLAHIDGYDIHFMHIPCNTTDKIPLVITHGWPYSVLEMMKIIPLLTGSGPISFDLVIPSMMGYGFSQKIATPGCNSFFMADLWYKLMKELGYSKFGLQGGDFGAGISAVLADKYPDAVMGMHLNYIPGFYAPQINENSLTEIEKEYIKSEKEWYMREGGYSLQQRTRPLTLSYGLNDSPVGLCAWIVEKMYAWSDCRGNIENVFTKDELLSNVTLYWLTETIHSSVRLYYENSRLSLITEKSAVPAGIARFRYEEPFPPRRYVEHGFNICRWSEFPDGGHFPAMEQPYLLTQDIREFFKSCCR